MPVAIKRYEISQLPQKHATPILIKTVSYLYDNGMAHHRSALGGGRFSAHAPRLRAAGRKDILEVHGTPVMVARPPRSAPVQAKRGCGYGLRQIPAPCGIDGIGCDP
ncbi:hypothetical protein AA0616_1850 [Komagataeibacter nataicola NRIC 0616]|nr:hypothetical protein AA0616_1850 [Komagataeibacter nataicola NRIC 0616]